MSPIVKCDFGLIGNNILVYGLKQIVTLGTLGNHDDDPHVRHFWYDWSLVLAPDIINII